MTQHFETDRAETRHPAVVFLAERWLQILLLVLVAVFVAQNRGDVSVHFFWMTLTSPLWLVLAILFVLGVVAGGFRSWRRRRRARR